MKKITLRGMVFAGVLAAVYAALTIASTPIAYGPIQFRISEALAALCCFTPYAIPGMVVGCIAANLFSTINILDIVIGTSATLIACLITRRIKNAWLMPLPTILCNAVIVGAEIAFFTPEASFWPAFGLNALTVGFGEAVVLYALGVPLFFLLKNNSIGRKVEALSEK